MEPTYKWKPVTDFYKEQLAAQPIDVEAENQQKIREVHEEAKRAAWVEKKAPLGIRVYTWYLFCRVGIYALLLAVLAGVPHSSVSTWLVSNIAHNLPGAAARERAAQQKEKMRKEAEAMGYKLPDYIAGEDESPEQKAQKQREEVIVVLFILAVLTAVDGFLLLRRFWWVRWGVMFISGATAVRAGFVLFALGALGVHILIPPEIMSAIVFTMGVNILIFCYLAFGTGVEEWFDN